VRFAIQTLSMPPGHLTFVKPIKSVGGNEKIVMGNDDCERMLVALNKTKTFKLVEGNNDRYRAALIMLLCIGCRPNEACKAASCYFAYHTAGKFFSLTLPKEITKTKEEYKWQLPVRFNNVWRSMHSMSNQLERLDYDILRKVYIEHQKELGIKTEFTLKSARKMVATKEYAAHVR
jgi:hypothetical protein